MFIESKYKIENSLKMSCDLSQEFTVIGMNKEALIEEDKNLEGEDLNFSYPKFLISKDTNLRIENALTYTYNALKNNNIVLLNECHNVPQDRLFFYTLLDSLQHYGFKSIFLETLGYVPNDSVYAQNNSIEDWGYYTHENVFHQVSHKLKNRNYKLYSYEVTYPRKIDTLRNNNKLYFINNAEANWIPIEADSLLLKNFFSTNDNIQREAEQALNIYEKIIKNKIKKAFIYCGYTHNFKSSTFMGGMLQHLMKEKIYSIDQMCLREHSDIKYENLLYTKYATVTYPFIITDKHNNTIHTIRYTNYITDTLFDVSIAFPRSIYINNRPTWLELNGDRKRYKLNTLMDVSANTDYLITIYDIEHDFKKNKDKTLEDIPVDVFQVIGSGKDYDAILTPNKKYRFIAFKDGKIITDKIIDTNE
ncbi:MAG: hypothetical protein ABI315_04160 [Bacteroidia bacterium]